MKTIDVTPTWKQILPTLLTIFRDATPKGRKEATIELTRMAEIADTYVSQQKQRFKGNNITTTIFNHPIDCFEVRPCKEFDDEQRPGKTFVEQCEPNEEPDFWSVYAHHPGAGLSCIADFKTENEANDFAATLESIGKMYVTEEEQG